MKKFLYYFGYIIVALLTGTSFYFFGLTRSGYLQNDFFQRNHIVLAFLALISAGALCYFNFQKGKEI